MANPTGSADIRDGLSAEERRGYDLALDQIQNWAREIEIQAPKIPPIETQGTLVSDLRSGARLCRAMVRALRQGFIPPGG